MVKVPQIGEEYYPLFESDYSRAAEYGLIGSGDHKLLTIQGVVEQYDEAGGFMIVASNGVGYDCYWSERFDIWVYFLDL